ncbi:MAG TPA: transketolase [Candidatus Omnitrophota bacterium]|nr:transketolase [Candidatus Omnitrophota bacterium]
MVKKDLLRLLEKKAEWVRRETLKIHGLAPETRIASSLSAVEVLTVLYYGKILKFRPRDVNWANRDRFIISKGHGSIALYPILADLGFFPEQELLKVCSDGALLGGIPDPIIPGYETVNGSLGHGLGVACGVALALREKKDKEKAFVLLGDGELYEGSIWEAVMFAGEHKLNNLIAIVDSNKICMLDYCKNILNLEPLDKKFKVFNWEVRIAKGHDIASIFEGLKELSSSKINKPKLLIADTIKGKGVPALEKDSLCHIRSLKQADIERLIYCL